MCQVLGSTDFGPNCSKAQSNWVKSMGQAQTHSFSFSFSLFLLSSPGLLLCTPTPFLSFLLCFLFWPDLFLSSPLEQQKGAAVYWSRVEVGSTTVLEWRVATVQRRPGLSAVVVMSERGRGRIEHGLGNKAAVVVVAERRGSVGCCG